MTCAPQLLSLSAGNGGKTSSPEGPSRLLNPTSIAASLRFADFHTDNGRPVHSSARAFGWFRETSTKKAANCLGPKRGSQKSTADAPTLGGSGRGWQRVQSQRRNTNG